jgi:hypothetical protein
MLWIDVYYSMFQFPPISTNICKAIEEWDNIPQAAVNSLINSMQRRSRCMRQMVVTPDTDWFSDPRPYLFKVSM